jgi:acetyltransferase
MMVRPDLLRQGIGRALLAKMIRYLRTRCTAVLAGECLTRNRGMAELARALGFTVSPSADGQMVTLLLDLRSLR